MNHRLFVALKISSDAQEQIVKMLSSFKESNKSIRWESTDKLHLTLKFIGEVNTNIKSDLELALNFINEYRKFSFSFTKFDCFPKREKPRILWIGMKITPDINELVNKINSELEKFNIPKEVKIFKPHITLLRLKEWIQYPFLEEIFNISIKSEEFMADEVALIESKLLTQGSVYKEIKNYKLK